MPKPIKGIKPPLRESDFDNMEPGEVFHYTGARSSGPIKLAYRLIRGKYQTWPDGKGGWWLRLIKPIKHMLDD